MEIDPRDETNEIEPYTTHHQYITHTQPSFIASKLFLAISSEQNACNVLRKPGNFFHFIFVLPLLVVKHPWPSLNPQCCCLMWLGEI
jgi:hypothetical protein